MEDDDDEEGRPAIATAGTQGDTDHDAAILLSSNPTLRMEYLISLTSGR